MEDGFNIHNIRSHKVVDRIRESLQSCSPKRSFVDWKCVRHTRNPLQGSFNFYQEAKSQIRIDV